MSVQSNVKNSLNNLKVYLMSGVSYMIPVIVVGGIFLAAALATGTPSEGGMVVENSFMKNVLTIGEAGFTLMIPVLAGYISYGVAGRPGLAPGLIAGYIANNPVGEAGVVSGFLGAIILGLASGVVAKWIKERKVPEILRPVMPIFIIPICTSFVVCIGYIYILANPISMLMESLTTLLVNMGDSSLIALAIILGLMIAFDMGGPINNVACMFAFGLMSRGVFSIMGIIGIAICTPPLGMGLATLLAKSKYNEQEKEAGKAALFMGVIGITEGAIPFAVSDPIRVIPSIMVGSAVGAVVGAIGKVANYAPHGGLIVLPVVENKMWYVLAVVVGTIVTALLVNFLKPKLEDIADNT